ncbi:MAG: GGDEF domain-containing protein [Armatimonadetes bacterium]|nr:GGDEF domain-containing protein [Armatimonadota bacterium]
MERKGHKSWFQDQTVWGVAGSTVALGAVFAAERLVDGWIGRDSGLDYLYLLPLWVAVSIGGRRAALASAVISAAVVSSLHENSSFFEPKHLAAFGVNLIALVAVAALFDSFGRSLARARSAASTDALTGIANRRSGQQAARAMASAAQASGGRIAVVALDCDGFKQINDQHGHNAGDAALKAIGKALAKSVRATDKVFRLGGDEFVMVLADAGSMEAEVCLGRLRTRLESVSADLGFAVRVSSGVSVGSRDGAGFDELLQVADSRLYRNKRLAKSFAPAASTEPAATA